MDPARLPHVPHALAPGSQTTSYLPWLKDSGVCLNQLAKSWKPYGAYRRAMCSVSKTREATRKVS